MKTITHPEEAVTAVGYTYLIETFAINPIPNWHQSFISGISRRETVTIGNIVKEYFPKSYEPGRNIGDHIEFAFKYDGINLEILLSVFDRVDTEELVRYIQSRPTGIYSRATWFLYEFLMNARLPLDDLKYGNYFDLLNTTRYYASEHGEPIQRQRIRNNLPGNRSFCPIVRKTAELKSLEEIDYSRAVHEETSKYSVSVVRRALRYLYTKETKSSFEIEHVKASAERSERFIEMLQDAESKDFCSKKGFLEVQNRIVDKRFMDSDYRTNQNYVGETVKYDREMVHYISPKPDDLPEMMEGLIDLHHNIEVSDLHPVIHAAVVSWGFVFLHPFEDGNGRIHRFLIHNILAHRGFTPKGLMFPVSAAMLNNMTEYDHSLESFSKNVMPRIDFKLDINGILKVSNDTANFYRYMDLTVQATALFRFIQRTIEIELPEEFEFIHRYDSTKESIQSIVDVNDRLADLFIRFCIQNKGTLARKKRRDFFPMLTDDEISEMEKAVVLHFNII